MKDLPSISQQEGCSTIGLNVRYSTEKKSEGACAILYGSVYVKCEIRQKVIEAVGGSDSDTGGGVGE